MLDQFRERKWINEIEKMVLDPKLGRRLIELGDCVIQLDQSIQTDDTLLHFKSVLNACSRSRSIRMLVGRLNRMQPEARNFAKLCLEFFDDLSFPLDKIDEDKREDYENAIYNIRHRLKLITSDEDEYVLADGTDDAFSNLLGT